MVNENNHELSEHDEAIMVKMDEIVNRLKYRKEYALRRFTNNGYEVTIPGFLLKRAAMTEDQTVREFAETHRVVFLFGKFTGFVAAFKFDKKEEK